MPKPDNMVGPFTESYYLLRDREGHRVPFVKARYMDGDVITLLVDDRIAFDLPAEVVRRPDFIDLLCLMVALGAGYTSFGPNATDTRTLLGPNPTKLRELGGDVAPSGEKGAER